MKKVDGIYKNRNLEIKTNLNSTIKKKLRNSKEDRSFHKIT